MSIEKPILVLLQLRIFVLTLGESHYAGWWKSQFMSQIGLSFLERVYPRSTFAAAIRSTTHAARIIHDNNVGKGDIFHLFRLSSNLEREINTILVEESNLLQAKYQPLLSDQTALLTELEKLTQDLIAPLGVGPLRLTNNHKWVSVMAAAYLNAFRENTQVFPYVEEQVIS